MKNTKQEIKKQGNLKIHNVYWCYHSIVTNPLAISYVSGSMTRSVYIICYQILMNLCEVWLSLSTSKETEFHGNFLEKHVL